MVIIQKHVCQYCRDLNPVDGAIIDFNADNATTDLLKMKEKITGKTDNNSM